MRWHAQHNDWRAGIPCLVLRSLRVAVHIRMRALKESDWYAASVQDVALNGAGWQVQQRTSPRTACMQALAWTHWYLLRSLTVFAEGRVSRLEFFGASPITTTRGAPCCRRCGAPCTSLNWCGNKLVFAHVQFPQ